ncbi:ABC transporter ATP-binding protein [Embleya sp. AB8]|uniref:ABC transporter ATP-binding protein n=1 Tax=Embleya sp. AB8 TaxID=3156304 RepID=UPI003C74C7AD
MTDRPASGGIVLRDLVKSYGDHGAGGRPALDLPELTIPPRSFTVVVGPSGCGKSTALRLIAGLETADAGRIVIDGVDVTDLPPGRRDLSMVFQDFALYPHMTVAENVSFGLRMQARHDRRRGLAARLTPRVGVGAGASDAATAVSAARVGSPVSPAAPASRAEIAEKVRQACALVRLDGKEQRRPTQLSGGERQRVALARALVRGPSVLLLDEPLSALDAQLRQHARAELVRLHREFGCTAVLVTHDQLEALSMATHLVVLDGGRLSQAGSPQEVYSRPANTFVAGFLGSPAMNLQEVKAVEAVAGQPAGVLEAPGLRARLSPGGREVPAGALLLGWRPADGVLADGGAGEGLGGDGLVSDGLVSDGLVLDGVVDIVEYTGDGRVLTCRSAVDGGSSWAVTVPAEGVFRAAGDRVRVRVAAERLHLFGPDGLRVPVDTAAADARLGQTVRA